MEPPDELTLGLEIDDKVLKEIIRHLYYPDCPYEFSVLSADILGQVYEQFLGKVIKLKVVRSGPDRTAQRAAVEEKPEVRKAGGVYYTPTYIVDYIVQQTVGKLLEGKTPKQAAKLKILDPACGSGSFLIGAYQYLLDWHRDRYIDNGPEKQPKEIVKVGRSGPDRPEARIGSPSPATPPAYLRFFGQYLEGFPVARIDTANKKASERRSQVEQLAQQMIDLHANLAATKPGHARTVLERQIAATDRQIDQLVYQLYNLSDAEIALVEQSTPK